MKTIEIKGVKRDAFGKKGSKSIRKAGLVPCVIYGCKENIHFSVEESQLRDLIYTPNSYIIHFYIDGEQAIGVMREVQVHPVKDNVLHVDFYHVDHTKPVAIDIPVKLTGISEGVRQGGKLMLSKRKLRVSGIIDNLPDTLDIDITNLQLGKSVFVNDVKFDGLTILTPGTTAICAVRMTRAARGAANAAAAEAK